MILNRYPLPNLMGNHAWMELKDEKCDFYFNSGISYLSINRDDGWCGGLLLEIRGQVATGNFEWNVQNFAGFYYDIDDNLGT